MTHYIRSFYQYSIWHALFWPQEDYTELNLTGRWMIKTTPLHKNRLLIEHKALFFKYWVDEGFIEALNARNKCVFECVK